MVESTNMSKDELEEYLKGKSKKYSVGKHGILVGILSLLLIAVLFLIALYISGWALTYLAHMLIGTTYYTSVTTRILLGLASWLTIGNTTSAISNKVTDKTNDKMKENF